MVPENHGLFPAHQDSGFVITNFSLFISALTLQNIIMKLYYIFVTCAVEISKLFSMVCELFRGSKLSLPSHYSHNKTGICIQKNKRMRLKGGTSSGCQVVITYDQWSPKANNPVGI